MKTPEQWADEWRKNRDDFVIEHFIERAQQEAFHEGQIAGVKMGQETAMRVINEVFSKPVEKESA